MFDMPRDKERSLRHATREAEPLLFPLRIGNKYPYAPIGKDLSFYCSTAHGIFYCKDDKDFKPIRATEWFFTRLANYLGIAVADCAVIEDEHRQTLFGSRKPISSGDEFAVRKYLTTPTYNELLQPDAWLGRHLSALYAIDLFIGNGDRCIRNFVLDRDVASDRLLAIDFADGQIDDLTSNTRFPIATSNTVCDGRFLRSVHRFSIDSATEMTQKIALVPLEVIQAILVEMPEEWLSEAKRSWLCEIWSKGLIKNRLSALRAGLENGSLL